MSIIGAGYLKMVDVLADLSYQLFEPIAAVQIISYTLFGGDITMTVPTTANFYLGALIVIGRGTPTAEAWPITGLTVNTITARADLFHANGDVVYAPTFPVGQPTNPLWTQGEMLAYVSTAANDFLVDVPLVYAINEDVAIAPTLQNGPLPDDCMQPERIAFLDSAGPRALRETSQANLDGYDYRWQASQAGSPQSYFRDKVPVQYFGIWPRVNNTAEFEVVYRRRQVQTMEMLDGFLFPDIFIPAVKYRALSFAYSKDGEARNPGLAKYFSQRYDFAVRVAGVMLESINDPNLDPSMQ